MAQNLEEEDENNSDKWHQKLDNQNRYTYIYIYITKSNILTTFRIKFLGKK